MVLGAVAALVGILTATALRPDDHVTVATETPETPVVLIDPGVLNLVSPTVTLKATAADDETPIVLAFAPTSDVEAWVGPSAHTSITGLSSWEALSTEVTEGEATVPNPAEADLWRDQITGTGELEVDITADPGQVTLLAATDGEKPAPSIELTWPREVTTPLFLPLLIGGLVAMAAGLTLLFLAKPRTATETEGDEAAVSGAASTEKPSRGSGRLSRRQLRELERQRLAEDPRLGEGGPVQSTGGGVGSLIVPAVLDPERFRALRYVDSSDDAAETLEQPAVDEDAPSADAPEAAEDTSRFAPEEAGDDIAAESTAAGPSRGSMIVPGRVASDAETVDEAGDSAGGADDASADETAVEATDEKAAAEETTESQESSGVSWRSLWGFNREEKR